MSAAPIKFLSIDDVLRIHEIALQDQGGDPSIRDRGLLESALAQPMQQFGGEYLHPDIPSMAAAYAFHICKNHPFVDGNKRAATAAMIMFLSDNGWRFDSPVDEGERVIFSLASGTMDKPAFTEWLTSRAKELPRVDLRAFFRAITAAQLCNTIDALPRGAPGQTAEQFAASVMEAAPAMPAIDELGALWMHWHRVGNSQAGENVYTVILTLMAIHRLAEDMGYEW